MDHSIDSCRRHASSKNADIKAHFLEDLNVSFQFESSILPSLTEFPKFKIKGKMKRLHMNLMDQKFTVIRNILMNGLAVIENSSAIAHSPYELLVMNRPQISISLDKINMKGSDSISSEEYADAREYLESTNTSPKRKIQDWQQVSMLFSFYISEASITLISESYGSESDILSELIISAVSIENVSRIQDLEFDCKISNIQMTNGISKNDLILSKSFESDNGAAVMSMNYTTVGRNSPNYKGYDSILSVIIESLTWRLAAEPILKVYNFSLDILESSTAYASSQSNPAQPVSPHLSSNSKTNILLNRMIFQFVDKSCFSAANFETMNLEVQSSSSIHNIYGKIGKFSISDLDALDENFTSFLKVEADQLIDFSLLSEISNNGGIDACLSLTASSIRVFYNPIFNARFLAYLSKFQVMYALMENARKSAIESAAAIKNQSDRFSYTVQCESPIIILPGQILSANQSSNLLWLYLYPGRMVLKNDFDSDDMFLSVYDMKVCSQNIELHLSTNFQQNIVEQFDLSVRLYAKNLPEGKTNCISAEIDDIKLIVDQEQYNLLVEIYQFLTRSDLQNPKAYSSLSTEAVLQKEVLQSYIYPTDSIQLCFKDVSLCIVENIENRQMMCEILLGKTYIEYSYLSDTSSSATITIKEAVFYNRLSSRPLFQKIVSHKNEAISQILITYNAPKVGSSKYMVEWDNISVLLELEFMYIISDFFSKPWISPNITIDFPNSSYVASYEFHLKESEMLLLDSAEKLDSEAILLKSQKISLVMNAITTINVHMITLFLTRMDLKETLFVKLVEPFNSIITLDTQIIGKGSYSTTFNLDLDPLAVIVAFSDIPMIYGILFKNLMGKNTPVDNEQRIGSSSITISEKVSSLT